MITPASGPCGFSRCLEPRCLEHTRRSIVTLQGNSRDLNESIIPLLTALGSPTLARAAGPTMIHAFATPHCLLFLLCHTAAHPGKNPPVVSTAAEGTGSLLPLRRLSCFSRAFVARSLLSWGEVLQ